uniref:Uncharacterized protein n=1 Tax=Syphacia muris TaxID=451379 RepID=A0A0N5AWZ0_9BILA
MHDQQRPVLASKLSDKEAEHRAVVGLCPLLDTDLRSAIATSQFAYSSSRNPKQLRQQHSMNADDSIRTQS